jgi:hypothetical protein
MTPAAGQPKRLAKLHPFVGEACSDLRFDERLLLIPAPLKAIEDKV